MLQNVIVSTVLAFALGEGLAAGKAKNTARLQEFPRFTHIAYIAAGSDADTIRFEKAKKVQVDLPIRVRSNKDADLCSAGASQAHCPYTLTRVSTPAYAVTYSFTGQPLASDELANRNFNFTVYFQPEELTPETRQALDARKWNRADLAALFTVEASPVTPTLVIDEKQSYFCPGSFADGLWVHLDATCQDKIAYVTAADPSDYLSVRVEPVGRGGRSLSRTICKRD